jgi:hypothetical protein
MGLLWFWVERYWDRVRHVADLMMAAAGLDLLMVFIHRQDLTTGGPSLWLYCFHLALFGLIGLPMHLLQRKAARPSSEDHRTSGRRRNDDMDRPEVSTTGKESR